MFIIFFSSLAHSGYVDSPCQVNSINGVGADLLRVMPEEKPEWKKKIDGDYVQIDEKWRTYFFSLPDPSCKTDALIVKG